MKFIEVPLKTTRGASCWYLHQLYIDACL